MRFYRTCIYACVSVVMHRFGATSIGQFSPQIADRWSAILADLYNRAFNTVVKNTQTREITYSKEYQQKTHFYLINAKLPVKKVFSIVFIFGGPYMSLTMSNLKPMQTRHNISSIISVRPFKEQTVTKNVKICDRYQWSAGPEGQKSEIGIGQKSKIGASLC